MKTFTEVEKTFAKNISKEYKWVARDSDGDLWFYREKPKKEGGYWYADNYDDSPYYLNRPFFDHLFPAIKWEDKEPTLISDIYNPSILNDAELEYLKIVLKPFHEEVKYVKKVKEHTFNEDNRDEEYLFIAFYSRGSFVFPDFDSGTLYSGMELDRRYSLDELNITY